VKTLVLLTGRKNSSLRGKNLLEIMGNPCMYYPISSAKAALGKDADYFCSSDCTDILDFSSLYGFTPIHRPPELASDSALHIDVLNHAMSKIDCLDYQSILVLLANAPVIHKNWIKKSVTLLASNPDITAVIPTIVDQDHHPFRSRYVNEFGFLESFFPNQNIISSNRQELPSAHFPAHNFWLIRLHNGRLVSNGDAPWDFFGDKVLPMTLPVTISDIHTEFDLIKLESEWSLWN
jgi:CMP-N,N'-diacetyllegionaminic acid synthase